MREKRFDVGQVVDALDPDRPMSRTEIARIPRKPPGPMLLELVAQRPRILLLRELEHAAERQSIEVLKDDSASVRLRQRAAVERDRGGTGGGRHYGRDWMIAVRRL